MRIKHLGSKGMIVWLSARDTYNWANRPGKRWPCSMLSGHRIRAEFDSNGLVDLSFDGHDSPDDLTSNEFDACINDLVGDQ